MSLSFPWWSSTKVDAFVSQDDKSGEVVTLSDMALSWFSLAALDTGTTWSNPPKGGRFQVEDSLHSVNKRKKLRPIFLAWEQIQFSHPAQTERVSFVKNNRKKVIKQKNPGVSIFMFDRKNFGLLGSLHTSLV